MNAYTTKYLQSVDTIFIPTQKAGSEFRRQAGSIGMVVGKWTELSQSQVWFVTESKSPFPIFYMVHVSNTLLIACVVPCECNTFLYIELLTLTQKLLDNCFENKVNRIHGVIGAPYRWSVEACKFREEQKLNGQSGNRKSSACSYQI